MNEKEREFIERIATEFTGWNLTQEMWDELKKVIYPALLINGVEK